MSVKVGDFSRAFEAEMIKYSTAIEKEIDAMTDSVAKDAVKELKEVSKSTFTARSQRTYYQGWASKNENVRHRSRRIIYHKTKPGLPHLLEHGHAKRNGGRVAGKIHIKPVEEKLIKEYEKNVVKIVEGGGE